MTQDNRLDQINSELQEIAQSLEARELINNENKLWNKRIILLGLPCIILMVIVCIVLSTAHNSSNENNAVVQKLGNLGMAEGGANTYAVNGGESNLDYFYNHSMSLMADGSLMRAYMGEVIVEKTEIFDEPSKEGNHLGSAMKGVKFRIKEKGSDRDGDIWYKVDMHSSDDGYVHAEHIEIVSYKRISEYGDVVDVEPYSIWITGNSGAIVYSDASTECEIMVRPESDFGMALTVDGTVIDNAGNEWFRVYYITGEEEIVGFLAAEYVSDAD